MIGLALEGGGVRGSYQAGAYIAFLECGIQFHGVCGTSIGALNGAVIASGKGQSLPTIWRNIDIGRIFGFREKFIEVVNENKNDLSYLKEYFLNILSIMLNRGIEFKGLRELIDKEIDVDALMNSPMDFGLVTVRLKDLKPIYLFKKDMPKEKIKDYIIASSSLPIFKLEKMIDDNYYLDGGFYDVGPVNMLLKKGYKKVYLVKIHGVGIHRKYDERADVVVIEPKRSLGSVLELDKKRIDENIKMGYYDTIRVLKNLDGYNYVFKRKSDSFYQRINRKITKKEFRRVKFFFNAKTIKETTIKAIEYIMEKEGMNYYQIYSIKKVIKEIKKEKDKDHFIYHYVEKLGVIF